jgi:apolipoprotein N-acyltransferase
LKEIKSQPDFIVWPENSVDVDPFKNPSVGKQLSQLASESSIPIIVGAVLKGTRGPENASILWSAAGSVGSTYVKRSLTPFGEYVPIRKLTETISPLAKNIDDFVKGQQIVHHKVGGAVIAPIICYEVINDRIVQSASLDANLIAVQTNNATFADSGQSRQQLNITRIRAIENNRWIISVSTTGVSAIIDNFGDIQQITKQNKPAYLAGEVDLISDRTFANKLGDWSALALIILAWILYFGKRRKHEK